MKTVGQTCGGSPLRYPAWLNQSAYYVTVAFIAFVNAALFAASGFVEE